MKFSRISILCVALLSWHCSKDDSSSSSELAKGNVPTTEGTSGEIKSSFSANATETQEVEITKAGSALKGTSLSIAPGSLSISSEITIEEGGDIADSTALSDLQLGSGAETVAKVGPSVVLSSSAKIDATLPFTLAIPVTSTGLALADTFAATCSLGKYLVVFFRVTKVAEGDGLFIGVIPKTELTEIDGKVSFKTQFFGAYQAACISVEVTEKKDVTTAVPIVKKGKTTELTGTWEGSCRGHATTGEDETLSEKARLVASEKDFSYRIVHYLGADCLSPDVTAVVLGTYTIGSDSSVVPGAKDLDVVFDKTVLTFHSFVPPNYCGLTNWELNVPQQIPDEGCDVDDGPPIKGEKDYTIFKVDGTKLYLGEDESVSADGSITTYGKTAETRSPKLGEDYMEKL
ncbi:MAG: hypothetical protein HYW48_01555 [Deltaproteobacteria bacterium]|nr:hypothetical protein [Deltaproteobacteria bacterium]